MQKEPLYLYQSINYYSKKRQLGNKNIQVNFHTSYLFTLKASLSSDCIEFWRDWLLNTKIELRRKLVDWMIDWVNSLVVGVVRRPYRITWKDLIFFLIILKYKNYNKDRFNCSYFNEHKIVFISFLDDIFAYAWLLI